MTDKHPLNARFIERLPKLMGQLLETQDAIAPWVDQARTALAEIQDYVSFEIQKLELAIERGKLDASGLAQLKRLRDVRDSFPASCVDSLSETIGTLHDALDVYMPDNLAWFATPSADDE